MSSTVPISSWIKAFRLRTLPLSFSCVGMGGFLAAYNDFFDINIFALSILTTLFLQILSNLANDYGDSIHGADGEHRKGPSRTVQEGMIDGVAMKKAIIGFAILSFVSGIVLLYYALGDHGKLLLIFLFIGIGAIASAIAYTNGKKPYGYMGLGDISVLIFFGFAGVLGSYFLYAKEFNMVFMLPALSCGLFAVAVLNINNIRDIESDKMAGKLSIPVRLGRDRAVVYHFLLLGTGFVSVVCFSILTYRSPFQLLFLLSLPLFIKNGLAVWKIKEPSALDPYLKQMALATLFFVILFGVGLLF